MSISLLVCLSLFAPTAHAGRGKSGFSAKKVTKYEISVDVGPGLEGAIIPGLASPLTIAVTDKRGRTLTTADGSLRTDSRKIQIEVDGGRYDTATGMITAREQKGESARKARVTVVASYDKRPDLEVIRVLPVDWRAVLGPDPGEVRDLSITPVSPELVDTWLLPGAALDLKIQARDVHGRTYTTGDSTPLRLPWSRLEIATEALEGADGHYRSAVELTREDRYQAKVVYTGADKAVSGEWRPDFQRLRGPEPDEVKSLRWSVDQPSDSPEGKVPLGSKLPVKVVLTTTEDRVFQTHVNTKMRLVTDRLQVRTERATWNPADATLVIDDAIAPGKPIRMDLRYQDLPKMGGDIELLPDYIGSIPDGWWTPGPGYAYGGLSGESGRSGQQGKDGVSGRESPGPETRAEPGTNGQAGSSGEDGQAGGVGPRVRVYAATAWALDRSERVVVYTVQSDNERSELRVARWDAKPVPVSSVGGHGGQGGDGGSGGNGGRGGDGCLSGDGGDAGDGADGGNGGDGGPGGNVVLIAAQADLLSHFDLRTQGGRGGGAGAGGRSGSPGGAPSHRSPSTEYDEAGNALPAPSCEDGRPGQDGRDGREGHEGHNGPPGATRTDTSADATAKIGSLPAELRRSLTW